jgi:secreted trypsin-like serine protease
MTWSSLLSVDTRLSPLLAHFTKFIGGEAQDTANLYPVSLVSSGWLGDNHVCGGAVVGSKRTLTTAHCAHGSAASSLESRIRQDRSHRP